MTKKCLVVNALSSSMNFKLYEMPSESLISNGLIEQIGANLASCKVSADKNRFIGNLRINNFADAFKVMKEKLLEMKVVDSLNDTNVILNQDMISNNFSNYEELRRYFEEMVLKSHVDGNQNIDNYKIKK